MTLAHLRTASPAPSTVDACTPSFHEPVVVRSHWRWECRSPWHVPYLRCAGATDTFQRYRWLILEGPGDAPVITVDVHIISLRDSSLKSATYSLWRAGPHHSLYSRFHHDHTGVSGSKTSHCGLKQASHSCSAKQKKANHHGSLYLFFTKQLRQCVGGSTASFLRTVLVLVLKIPHTWEPLVPGKLEQLVILLKFQAPNLWSPQGSRHHSLSSNFYPIPVSTHEPVLAS